MTTIGIIVLTLNSITRAVGPSESCAGDDNLRKLDAGWEHALLKGDVNFLRGLVADEFVWVHDHASAIDTKESLTAWISSDESGMSSRRQTDVEIRRLETTAVVMGYTIVKRRESSTRYRFMRTYVGSEGSCRLLANQTMAMPEGG